MTDNMPEWKRKHLAEQERRKKEKEEEERKQQEAVEKLMEEKAGLQLYLDVNQIRKPRSLGS